MALSLVVNSRVCSSGILPVTVWLDTFGTTSDATTRFTEIGYKWTITGGSLGTFPSTGRTKNTLWGPCISVTIATAGTYTFKCHAVDADGSFDSDQVVVTVNALSGLTQHHYYSTNTDFTGAPAEDAGPQTIFHHPSITDIGDAINDNMGDDRAHYLHDAQTFATSTLLQVTADTVRITKFGTGAKPIIQTPSSGAFTTIRAGISGTTHEDFAIWDVEIDGQSNIVANGIDSTGLVDDVTILRVDIHDLRMAIAFDPINYDAGAVRQRINISMADCIIEDLSDGPTDAGGCGWFGGGTKISATGNIFRNCPSNEHLWRSMYFDGLALLDNSFQAAGLSGKHCVALRAPPFDVGQGWFAAGAVSQYANVNGNLFIPEGSGSGYAIEIANQTQNQHVENVLIDRCKFKPGIGAAVVSVGINSDTSTIQNCIFDYSDHDTTLNKASINIISGFGWQQDDVHVYNVTMYSSAADDGQFHAVRVSSESVDAVIKNTIAYQADDTNTTSAEIVSDSGTGTTGATGTQGNSTDVEITNTNPFSVGSPVNDADFALSSGSYARTGVAAPVFYDYFGESRINVTPDSGAVQFTIGDDFPSEAAPTKLTMAWL